MAVILRRYGHAVRVARHGPGALQAALADHPDVVLLDLGLPGMDGWSVAEQLRRHANGWAPLIIAISGYGHPEARRRSAEAGIVRHLLKPVEIRQLVDLLNGLPERGRGGDDGHPPVEGLCSPCR